MNQEVSLYRLVERPEEQRLLQSITVYASHDHQLDGFYRAYTCPLALERFCS